MSLRDWFARAVAAEQERVTAAIVAEGETNGWPRPPVPGYQAILARIPSDTWTRIPPGGFPEA